MGSRIRIHLKLMLDPDPHQKEKARGFTAVEAQPRAQGAHPGAMEAQLRGMEAYHGPTEPHHEGSGSAAKVNSRIRILAILC